MMKKKKLFQKTKDTIISLKSTNEKEIGKWRRIIRLLYKILAGILEYSVYLITIVIFLGLCMLVYWFDGLTFEKNLCATVLTFLAIVMLAWEFRK